MLQLIITGTAAIATFIVPTGSLASPAPTDKKQLRHGGLLLPTGSVIRPWERRGDLSARTDFDPIADTDPNEGIVREGEPVPERHSEMIPELERSCAGASLFPVNDDEIRIDIRREHRLADCEELPRMSDAKLEARGLAAGQSPHLANETDELDGRREHGVV